MLRHDATCWVLLQWLKFENGQILHATFVDVAGCCSHLVRFVQHCCPRACALVQQVTTRLLCQQSCDMLRRNVAIVWPGLANTGPTMLRYVALNCRCFYTAAIFSISKSTTVQPSLFPKLGCIEHLDRVTRKMDNALHRINHYPVDSVVCSIPFPHPHISFLALSLFLSPHFPRGQNTKNPVLCSQTPRKRLLRRLLIHWISIYPVDK